MRTQTFKRVWAFVLAITLTVGLLPVSALAASTRKVPVPEDRVFITSSKYAIVPGMEELVLTTNNTSGTDQLIGYLLDVDAGNFANGDIQIVACYKDHAYDSFGLQTVTDQAAAYERDNPGKKVVGGINADFFNMNTGEPAGAFVMDGTVYHEAHGRPYFAILNDGTAVIRDGSVPLDDVYQAVGGDQFLVKDGVAQQFEGDYASLKYSRCAIGIRADGSVVTYTTHGISAPTSCGETYNDLAANFVAQGCVIALNVDGGGSATMASLREGTEKLTVQNSPSDGTPRTVSTTLLFVSTVASDGEFHHASLSPNNAYYTPTQSDEYPTTVQFEAVGVDASGAKCELPASGLTWALTADYTAAGTIDAETGLFTAAKGYTGTVGVELLLNGEAVGETVIQIVEPESIAFSGTGVSLKYEESTDLGLTVKGAGVILNHKVGDFTWTVDCITEGVEDSVFGTMSGNIFTSGVKQAFAMEGNITATYTKADGTTLSATIFAEVGKMPVVVMDFEDISGPNGKNTVALWDWGTTKGYFFDSTGNPVDDQVYEFQHYDTLYYLQSTTYSGDAQWIDEVYTTEQPWVEHEDGTITYTFNGVEYTCVKEETYGQHAEKWISFTDANGDGYYWRGYMDGDTWSGNFNAGGGSASAFLGADGYDLYVWHTNANKTDLSGTLHGAGSQIVDATEGEVRFGKHALKLTYDYRNFSPTGGTKNCNTYYRVTKPLKAQGSPTGLGMWVYAPEGMSNFWFWTAITYWNGTQWATAYPHFTPAGAEKSCQFTGVNWTGWTYVEADLSSVYAAGAIVDAEHPLQVRSGNALIQMTYIPGGTNDGEGNAIVCGSKSEGYFYIDNVRWVYGTNVDDMDSPVIMGTSANNTSLSTAEPNVLNSNNVSFSVDFTDPQGENFSGIDETATQIFLDGSVLPSSMFSASADRAQTVELTLANGEHVLEIHISDNFGNKTSRVYKILVNNPETTIPVVTIKREDAAELGSDYKVVISADSLANIAGISTVINYDNKGKLETKQVYMHNNKFYDDYGNELTLGSDGQYYDANGNLVAEPIRPNHSNYYFISSAVQALGENLTGTIRNKVASNTTRTFTATATVNAECTDDTTLLTFTLPVPSNFTDVDKVPVTITVTFTTTDGKSYTVSTGKLNNAVEAYYELSHGIQVSGAENGTLTVTTKDDTAIDTTNLQVFVDGTAIDGTWNGNVFTTSYFTGLAANTTLKNVYVGDAVNKHYSFLHTVDVCGYAPEGAFSVTLNATSGDTTTMQQITWMSGLGSVPQNIQLQYMTKAEYEAANGDFTNATSVTASSVLTDFILGGVDYVAAYINNVTLSDLTPGTEYVCRAGDGNGHWSDAVNFKTEDVGETTDFVVIGDAQLHGDDTADADAIVALKALAALNKGIDFGIQTGDFVDGGTNFKQWEQILRQFGSAFDGIDFVHTMGNHEAYTSNGTPATIITTRLFGLTDTQTKFYSVEYGDVYIAVINQAATANLNEAAQWLIEDAAKTDCTWKVMVTHQPVYYTNPNGSSQGHNQILAPACDAAGIDFVFSGHDHAYARTEQMLAGKPVDLEINPDSNAYVDSTGFVAPTQGQGTVYFICGSMDPGGEYAVINNPDFHFAKATNEYNSLYLTIEATDGKFTVNSYDMDKDGNATLIDTYTMYNGAGICDEAQSHAITDGAAQYNPETGKLVCEVCGEELDPAELGYTGFANNINGVDTYGDSQYYFFVGALKTGWFPMGADFMYANEDGLIDHAVVNYATNTCTSHGKNKAYSPRYNVTYTGGIARYTGHNYVENDKGELVCTNTHCVTTENGYKVVDCAHVAIDIADWDFSLSFTSTTYTGKSKTPAIVITNPATGETLEFHTDGEGVMTDYTRTWSNNRNVGIATVTIEANPNGDYTNSNGAVTLTLRINPAAPTNVAASAVDSTTANVTWSASAQADLYRVYYRNENGKWQLIGETDETSYTVTDLDSATEYEFAVRAVSVVDDETLVSLKYSESATCTTASGLSIADEDISVSLTFTKTTYNGNKKRPTPTLKDADGNVLVRGTDYSVEWIDNVNAGTGKVVITGEGIYSGVRIVEFSIARQNMEGTATVTAPNVVFNGVNTTNVTVVDKNGRTMIEDVDYTLTYSNNESAGTATVTVTGIGNYVGTIVKEYTIAPVDMADCTVDLSYTTTTYGGGYKLPAVTVTGPDGTVLTVNVDYKVTYVNNKNAGTATVEVTGIGNYAGTVKENFTIKHASLNKCTVTVKGTTFYSNGSPITPDVVVKTAKGTTLVEGVNYTVSYENNVAAGTATVIVTGIGNYAGTLKTTFTIRPTRDISKENFTATLKYTSMTYTGEARCPAVTLKTPSGTVLKNGTNYIVTYTNNVEVGTATVTITGIGKYSGTITKTFKITPEKIKTLTVKEVTDSTITINFQHVDSADKYYIYVNGEYYGCSKTLSTYKIKGLESGETYTIYIKSVKVIDGKNYISGMGNKVTATTN